MEYKELAEQCCDADPDKRPNALDLYYDIDDLLAYDGNDIWNTVYHNDVKPLSHSKKRANIQVHLNRETMFLC